MSSFGGIYMGGWRKSRNRAACCSYRRQIAAQAAAGADWEGRMLGSVEPQLWRKLLDTRMRMPVMRSRMGDQFWP